MTYAETRTSCSEALSRLYQSLAEVLMEPPTWLKDSGDQWPLFADVLEVAQGTNDSNLYQILSKLAEIPSESIEKRRANYRVLFFGGAVAPPLRLYESQWRDGRLAGPSTFEVWQTYEAVGLNVADSELPDHASLELAFIAFLITQEVEVKADARQWQLARRLFVKHHADQWLPSLGKVLAASNDTVYAPIGQLLTVVVRNERRPQRIASSSSHALPDLAEPEQCNLCSFCVQVCPTCALAIQEDNDTTALLLNDTVCISCRRCVRTCPTNALQLISYRGRQLDHVLRHSARLHCPACGAATVSAAEMNAIIAKIGNNEWLKYCIDCRTLMLERNV